MPPDMDKDRSAGTYSSQQQLHSNVTAKGEIERARDELMLADAADDLQVECTFTSQRVRTNFSYLEQPVRAYLQPLSSSDKRLGCTQKGAVFLTQASQTTAAHILNEFYLLPQPNGTILLQSCKHNRILCSDAKGAVYASETCHEAMEQWTIQERRSGGGFFVASAVSQRKLGCVGNVVRTMSSDDAEAAAVIWKIDFTSGELCFLSLPCMDKRLRCDLTGMLSLSTNFKGWEAWRFSEAGNGKVRISPWAHATHYLSCNDQGRVSTTETERGSEELWTIEPARFKEGVLIQSSEHRGRYLCFDAKKNSFIATKHIRHFKEHCVWQLDSLHQSTYYLENSDCKRRLVGTARGSIDSSGLPMKRECEEWKVERTSQQGVVKLYSCLREGYLASDASGQVSLATGSCDDGSEKWIVEEHDGGNVLVSQLYKRDFICNKEANKFVASTIPRGDEVSSSAFWLLDPKTPRQVNKEKMKAVGYAVALGVATTVATPLVLGGAIGIVGVTEVGIAGRAIVGSIRAVEAVSTISRVTFSSSQLMTSNHSLLASYRSGSISQPLAG